MNISDRYDDLRMNTKLLFRLSGSDLREVGEGAWAWGIVHGFYRLPVFACVVGGVYRRV